MTLNYDFNNLDYFDDYTCPELNKYAVARIQSKEELIEQLKHLHMHGVSTSLSSQLNDLKSVRFTQFYLIPVFQQEILAYYKQTKYSTDNWINSSVIKNKEKIYFERVNDIKSKREKRKIKEQVIRSVYALNLDYALVKIGISASRPLVIYVNAFPETNSEIKNLFQDEIDKFNSKWKQNKNTSSKGVVLGADPEFILRNSNGQLVLASKYLPKNGLAGCDRIWTNRDRNQLPLAELRPTPAEEPRQLIINLYKSMLLANKKIQDKSLIWQAGAMPIKGYSLGGHIHFSNIWLNSFLLRALDNYLTLTITVLEDKQGITRRPKYGFLGDYREQFHGGFEYRTLPSWLVSPTLSKGVISLAKLVAENYQSLKQNPLSDFLVQKAYYRGDKEVLRPIVNKLWSELKQIDDYSLYENYLSSLEVLIKNNYSWNETIDFRSKWLLPSINKKKKNT